jgi:hypothetical protein
MIQEPKKLISPIIQYFLDNHMCRSYTQMEGEKSTLVTLNLPTANYQQPYYFTSQTMLDGDNAIITGINLVATQQLSYAPNGQENYPYYLREIKESILTISNLKREIIAQLPMSILWKEASAGAIGTGNKPCFTWFTDQVWANCFVEFIRPTVAPADPLPTPTQPLIFQVWYIEKEKN